MMKRVLIGALAGALIMPAYAAAYYYLGSNGIQILTVTLGFAVCGAAIALAI
jgi:hypothetical protein